MGCDQKVRAKAGSDPPTSEIYCDGDCDTVYDDDGKALTPACAYIVMLKATGNLTEEEQKPGCHCFFAGPLLGFKGGKVDTAAGLAWDATQKGKYFDAAKKPRKEIKGSGKWIKVDGSKDVQRAWVLG